MKCSKVAVVVIFYRYAIQQFIYGNLENTTLDATQVLFPHIKIPLHLHSTEELKKPDFLYCYRTLPLLPLNGCRGLAGNVVDDAVDVFHFVYNAHADGV